MRIPMNFALITIFLIISLIFVEAEEVTSSEHALFENIVRESIGNEKIDKIVSIEKKSVTKRKSNFSHLSRVIVVYNASYFDENTGNNEVVNKTIKFIMKNEPKAEDMTDATKSKYIRKMKLFETEAIMLRDVVPWIEEAVGHKIGPKFYYYSEIDKILIMEDLAFSQFVNRKLDGGMSDEDITMVLEMMADFHAGSVLMNEQNSTIATQFKVGLVNNMKPNSSFTHHAETLRSLADYLQNSSDKKYHPISTKLSRISKHMKPKLLSVYNINHDEFAVINHGDAWYNNFMFKDDEYGKTNDTRFIDYQTSIWSSPAIDLLEFFGCMPSITEKLRNDKFLAIYLTRLTEIMRKIGCATTAPTMEQLKSSMHRRRVYIVYEALILAPEGIIDAEGVDRDTSYDNSKSPWDRLALQDIIKTIIPILNDKGYLD